MLKHPTYPLRRALTTLLLTVIAWLLLASCSSGLPTPASTSIPAQPTRTAAPAGLHGNRLPPATLVPSATSTGVAGKALAPADPSSVASPEATATVEQPEPSVTPSAPMPATSPTQFGIAGTVTPSPTILPENERVLLFNKVWNTVVEHYLYPDFHGVDWTKLRTEYEPKIKAAQSAEEYYGLISDMVEQLKDDHSSYLSPWDAEEEDNLISGNTHYVGVGILSRHEPDRVAITYVFPGSPAEKAGLKRRDVITAVNGAPFSDTAKEGSSIRGPEGSSVTLTVRSPEQPPRDVTLVRAPISGDLGPSGSRVGADNSIGYLVIPSFDTDNMDALVEDELGAMLDQEPPLKGLIIDLRGNGGGLLATMEHILGQFVTGRSGRYASKQGGHSMVTRKGSLYDRLKDVPVVILVDKGSESAAEMFTAAMRERGRAQVVGITSAGNTETVYPFDFSDGSRLWLAEEGFQLLDGTSLEGKGVVPDAEIKVDWTNYTEAHDPHILKAIELLKANKQHAR